MNIQDRAEMKAESDAAINADAPKRRGRNRTGPDRAITNAKKSKKDRLIALLSKPNGARVAVITERLQWQRHTVRAALSGLRKQGFGIATSKSAKTGETVYAITSQPASGSDEGDGAAA